MGLSQSTNSVTIRTAHSMPLDSHGPATNYLLKVVLVCVLPSVKLQTYQPNGFASLIMLVLGLRFQVQPHQTFCFYSEDCPFPAALNQLRLFSFGDEESRTAFQAAAPKVVSEASIRWARISGYDCIYVLHSIIHESCGFVTEEIRPSNRDC